MSIPKGTRLGSYEVESPIGAGGMGEVYRARDTRLGRSVAIKVLPRPVADDPERIARFEREGKVLASLNHPHIAALHGMEEFHGGHFLVMELVEGETLADRIFGDARRPPRALEVDEAIAIARQVAQALEAAHEQGIIHRDLKPANIKLRPDGTVKVLDFGLAKALEPAGAGGPSAGSSATITTPAMTQVGVILGTAAYMSPEQAKGRAADKRSDMWAFGCVLYEMLTGRRAFDGEDVSDTLASVLKADPDWTALPPNLPHGVRALVHGCLRKDRRERIGDVSTALFLLNQQPAMTAEAPATRTRRFPAWQSVPLVLAGVVIGAAIATAAFRKVAVSSPASVARFAIVLPQDQPLTLPRRAIAISIDGKQLAYAASGRLFVRWIAELESRVVPGAEGAVFPLFSPDGQSLVYWTNDTIKRIGISGGTPVTVCQVSPAPAGLNWTGDSILIAHPGAGILRVAATGGRPEQIIRVNASEGIPLDPQLLPDGDTVLFTLGRRRGGTSDLWKAATIVMQSLATGKRTTLIEGGTGAQYVPTGHLVYAVAGTLFAVPFDVGKLAVTGGPVPVVEGVRRATVAIAGGPQFAFSPSGALVYVPGPLSGGGQALALFDRAGRAGEPLKLPPGSYAFPRVAPDGKRIAFETIDRKEAAIFIYDLSGTSSPRRLTFGGNNRFPVWSADGRRIAFQSDREGTPAVFWQSVEGGPAERLTKPDPDTSHVPEAWSPIGDFLLFDVSKGTENALWAYSVRDRKASPLADIRSIGFPTNPAFSPDGRWFAYQVGDGERGEATLFVQPFPPTGATTYQIAIGGRPLWSRRGMDLFFVPAPNEFRVVTIKTQPTFDFTAPVAIPRRFGMAEPSSPRPYDILPDGRLLAVATAAEGDNGPTTQGQINVVLNWLEELKARVPTR